MTLQKDVSHLLSSSSFNSSHSILSVYTYNTMIAFEETQVFPTSHREQIRLFPSMFGNTDTQRIHLHVRLGKGHDLSLDMLKLVNIKSSFKGNFPLQGGNILTETERRVNWDEMLSGAHNNP